jgi:hypothetical protein
VPEGGGLFPYGMRPGPVPFFVTLSRESIFRSGSEMKHDLRTERRDVPGSVFKEAGVSDY